MINVLRRDPTPNPNAFMFVTDQDNLAGGLSLSISNPEDAVRLTLAQELFDLEDVTAVLITDNFVSVSGSPGTDWDVVEESVRRSLTTYSVAEATRIAEEFNAKSMEAKSERIATDDVFAKIEEILDKYVRPALAGDGGGVELVDVEGNIVTIRYQGACGSCPTSTANTLMAIENLLQDQVDPEIVLQPG